METIIKTQTKRRRSNGFTITELLVTTILLGGTFIVISELAVLTTFGSLKISNTVEGLTAARVAINRISADVRQARAVGDYYGQGSGRMSFPDSLNNPIYPASAPTGGWPLAPWSYPMTISDTTLVLQIPVLYKDPVNANNTINGFPIMIPRGAIDGTNPSYNLENLDTVVYQVVPDPRRSNEFLLQVARFPGVTLKTLPSTATPPINPPQTILKGLIGPQLSSGTPSLPSIFTYLARAEKPYSAAAPMTSFQKVQPSPSNIDSIQGIGIDIEIKNTGKDTATADDQNTRKVGMHTEAFMRSNRNMRLNNSTI